MSRPAATRGAAGRRLTLAGLALAVAAVPLAAGAASADDRDPAARVVTSEPVAPTGSPASPRVAADPFYTPPQRLPKANGALVRTAPQKLGVSLQLPGQTAPLPAAGTKIMYKSTDQNGHPVAVTGAYLEPTARWTGSGARPVVAVAEGTQGQGDNCAPTRSLESVVSISSGDGTALGYEIPNIYALLARGIAVVVTDYVGLGTPDRVHSYTDRVDMGHAVLDSVRAALNLRGTTITGASPVGLYGYSQGGGATGAAAELAPSYAPSLNLKGAYVGAPPADLRAVVDSADGTSLTGVIGFAINGIAPYYPRLPTVLDAQTNAAGKRALARVQDMCVAEIIFSYAYAQTSSWTKSGQSAGDLIDAFPAVRRAIADQRIGRLKPTVPTMVLSGTQDDIVDHGQVRQLAKDWCGQGAKVTYVPVVQPLPSAGTALNHLGPAITRLAQAQNWLVDRLRGERATSNCGSLPALP